MYEHVQPSYFKEVRDEYKKRRDAVVEEPVSYTHLQAMNNKGGGNSRRLLFKN